MILGYLKSFQIGLNDADHKCGLKSKSLLIGAVDDDDDDEEFNSRFESFFGLRSRDLQTSTQIDHLHGSCIYADSKVF